MIRASKGFTLIELLVVIALVGILSGAVIVAINPARYSSLSRDTHRKSDLQVVQQAIEMFYSQQSAYPTATDATNLNVVLSSGGAWTVGSTSYLSRTPTDPLTGHQAYCYVAVGSGYLLCAAMEGTDSAWHTGSCNSLTYNYCLQNIY